jgi:hypothetical protein
MHVRLKTLLWLVSAPLLLVTAAYIQWGTVGHAIAWLRVR